MTNATPCWAPSGDPARPGSCRSACGRPPRVHGDRTSSSGHRRGRHGAPGRLPAMSAALTAAAAIAVALGARPPWGAAQPAVRGAPRHLDPRETAPPDTAGLRLSSTGPTIVHFTAVWCGPLAPRSGASSTRCWPICRRWARRNRHGRQSRCGPDAFGVVVTDDVHLRRRRTAALPVGRGPQSGRPQGGADTLLP